MDYTGQNLNRVHAVKKIGKGLRDNDNAELEIFGAMANAFIYIGDAIENLNDTMKKRNDLEFEHEDELNVK